MTALSSRVQSFADLFEPVPAERVKGRLKRAAYLFVGLGTILPLAGLLPEIFILVPDLNDGAFHLGILQATIQAIREGCNPLDFWFPNWLCGFPLFHYYQPGPYLLMAGAWFAGLGLASPLLILRITNTLAICLFPYATYRGLRWMGLKREEAGAAALLSTLIASDTYGIEFESFVWRGWGLFAQAAALPFLPLALGGGWRAIQKGRRSLGLAAFLAGAFLTHILYGYIAALSLGLVPLAVLAAREFPPRLFRLVRFYGQTIALAGFFLIPLLLGTAYHAKSLYDPAEKFDSHGAKVVLTWVFSGKFLDNHRLPVVTAFAAAGIYLAARRWLEGKSRVHGWIVIGTAFWTLLYFGRATWGSLVNLLPMTHGLHMERLSNGLLMFGIILGGIGLGSLARRGLAFEARTVGAALSLLLLVLLLGAIAAVPWPPSTIYRLFWGGLFVAGAFLIVPLFLAEFGDAGDKAVRSRAAGVCVAALVALLAVILWPVLRNRHDYLLGGGNLWSLKEGKQLYGRDRGAFEPVLNRLLEEQAKDHGRVYAGHSGNWGRSYKVGNVSVYHHLSSAGAENVGHMPYSWALTTDFQGLFHAGRQEDYDLYNVRYLLTDRPPEEFRIGVETEGRLPAELLAQAGPHRLWRVPSEGPFSLVAAPLHIRCDKDTAWYVNMLWANGSWSKRKAHARLIFKGPDPPGVFVLRMEDPFRYLPPGEREARHLFDERFPRLFDAEPPRPPKGRLENASSSRNEGKVTASLEEKGMLLFKNTFHPNWRAYVNGRRKETVILTPGLIGVPLEAGRSEVVVRYEPGPVKLILLVLGIAFAWGLDRPRALRYFR